MPVKRKVTEAIKLVLRDRLQISVSRASGAQRVARRATSGREGVNYFRTEGAERRLLRASSTRISFSSVVFQTLPGWLLSLCASGARLRIFKLLLICLVISGALLLTSCGNEEQERAAAAMTGGSPQRGRTAISRYGCATCHTIPGIHGADALVGPPLTQMGSRSYIAGVLPNTPDNMIRWLRNPPQVDHLTAMPNLGVTDQDARDIAGYLYTLK